MHILIEVKSLYSNLHIDFDIFRTLTQYFKIWFIQSLIFLSLKKKKKITELSLISQLANLPVIFYHLGLSLSSINVLFPSI